MKRIVVLVSGRGSNLDALITSVKNGAINGEIVGVISNQPNAHALQKAKHQHIATSVVNVDDIGTDHYETTLIKAIQKYLPDLILLAGFMRLLSPHTVSLFQGRIMNIHPSLLPAYKGLNTHHRVLAAGDLLHGCSVHFVTPELDAGPLIVQAQVPVKADDNRQTLAARVLLQEHKIYPYAAALFCANRIKMHRRQCLLDDKVLERPLCFNH